MFSALTGSFLKWIKGPIAIVAGTAGTWLYTNVPGLHVFGVTATSAGKWISGALVFAISSGVVYLSHDQAVTHLIERAEKDFTEATGAPATPAAPAPSSLPAADGIRASS